LLYFSCPRMWHCHYPSFFENSLYSWIYFDNLYLFRNYTGRRMCKYSKKKKIR
jgi:hypothetical protein